MSSTTTTGSAPDKMGSQPLGDGGAGFRGSTRSTFDSLHVETDSLLVPQSPSPEGPLSSGPHDIPLPPNPTPRRLNQANSTSSLENFSAFKPAPGPYNRQNGGFTSKTNSSGNLQSVVANGVMGIGQVASEAAAFGMSPRDTALVVTTLAARGGYASGGDGRRGPGVRGGTALSAMAASHHLKVGISLWEIM